MRSTQFSILTLLSVAIVVLAQNGDDDNSAQECLLTGDVDVPDGCRFCHGPSGTNPGWSSCQNTEIQVHRCANNTNCVSRGRCQTGCTEPSNSQEQPEGQPIQQCSLSVNGQTQLIPPNCQFCTQAAGQVTQFGTCQDGQNQLSECPFGTRCEGRGQCRISCDDIDD